MKLFTRISVIGTLTQLLTFDIPFTISGFSVTPSILAASPVTKGKWTTMRYTPSEDNENEVPSWLLDTAARRARLVQEQENDERFATGKDLVYLRTDLAALEENLEWAVASDDPIRIGHLTEAIQRGKEKDPELVYINALEQLRKAERSLKIPQKYDRISFYKKEAAAARSYIPRLNLDGVWIGKFGEHGSELINVTYTGDILTATKITGDKHVPRGQVSFTVDLSPTVASSNSTALTPIELSDMAASVWGTDSLPRYPGKGHIAAEGFKNNRFVDGQLIMFDGYFSFLWNPTKQNIFFTRPPQNLILSMMRDVLSEEDEVDNMRNHLSRCFEKDISDAFVFPTMDKPLEPFKRIQSQADLNAALEEKILENDDEDLTSQMKKWMAYIDEVLADNKGNKKSSK
jgi:hypothetical protein